MFRQRILCAAKLGIAAAVPLVLYAFPGGPPPAKTGAPGEGTCRECHSGGAGGGRVEIVFPGGAAYTPGVKQQFTVTITDPDAGWYGFELSTRLASDNSQAGSLAPAAGETNIRVICANFSIRGAGGCPAAAPVEYIQHSQPRQANSFRVEWTPPAADRGPVRIYVAANAANGNGEPSGDDIYTASYALNVAGQPTNAPKITSAGIVNAASFAPGLSPGSFVTIFGENLAPRTRSWDGAIQGTALPRELEGVSVTVGGKAAFIAHMVQSPGQLNVVLPTDELAGSVEVKVTNAQGSAAANAVLEPYAPAFFPSSLARVYAAATHADNTAITKANQAPGVASRPAQPGEEIMLWGTGFGPTAEQVPSGQVLTKAYPLLDPSALRVRIGGRDARVTFAGVTLAGVYQINVVVPADLADGDHPLEAEIGARRTQANVFLAVQRPVAGVGIRISYRLDPWLISGNYAGGLWVSPPVFGPVTQGGTTFALVARAHSLDAQGQASEVAAAWKPADADMVSIAPGQSGEVTITVRRPGQTTVEVSDGGSARVLAVKATALATGLQVEIAQL